MINVITTNEAAQRLNLDPSRVRKLCRQGRLGTKHGRDWFITEQQLAGFIKIGPLPGGRPRKDER